MRLGILLVGLGLGCGPLPMGPDASLPAIPTAKPTAKQPPDHVVGGFVAEVPPTTLAPGEERFACYIFPLEISGPSNIVGGASLTIQAGMHHGNVTTRPQTGAGLRKCPPKDSGLNSGSDVAAGGTVVFGSSTQLVGSEWQTFPPGMGYRVKTSHEIVARLHYLNASSKPITVAPKYQWYTIDESSLKTELGPFLWTYTGFAIPPHVAQTVTGSCTFPHPMHLVNLLPHMHKLGTHFSAGYLGGPLDGKSFLESPGYDPDNGVLVQYDPAVDLGLGDGARFSCTWNNTFDKTIVEGVGDDEMCMMFGYAYPPGNAYSVIASEGDNCVALSVGLPQD